MTPAEAKEVLLRFRPHAPEAEDPEFAVALELARHDPELQQWWRNHQNFQRGARRAFTQISVPADLKERILTGRKIVPIWQQPVWLPAAAAAVLLLAGLVLYLAQPRRPDRFDDYRRQMIRSAVRQYRMDIVTNDLEQVRQYHAKHDAPADYRVPGPIAKLKITGGGRLKWRDNPVSMLCFDRGDSHMLFLFVMGQSAIKDPPKASPEIVGVSDITTASWTASGKTYVLIGEESPASLEKYLR